MYRFITNLLKTWVLIPIVFSIIFWLSSSVLNISFIKLIHFYLISLFLYFIFVIILFIFKGLLFPEFYNKNIDFRKNDSIILQIENIKYRINNRKFNSSLGSFKDIKNINECIDILAENRAEISLELHKEKENLYVDDYKEYKDKITKHIIIYILCFVGYNVIPFFINIALIINSVFFIYYCNKLRLVIIENEKYNEYLILTCYAKWLVIVEEYLNWRKSLNKLHMIHNVYDMELKYISSRLFFEKLYYTKFKYPWKYIKKYGYEKSFNKFDIVNLYKKLEIKNKFILEYY